MDPMEEFGRQLEEIINTYGSAASLIEKQCIVLETEEVDEEASREQGDEVTATKDASTDKDTKKLLKALGEGLVSPFCFVSPFPFCIVQFCF